MDWDYELDNLETRFEFIADYDELKYDDDEYGRMPKRGYEKYE